MTTTRMVIACALALAACVQPGVVHCEDGRTCPAGTVCAGAICALPTQLAACDGQPDGMACTFPGSTGVCMSGVCLPVGCGNGVRDADEACDDGNRESGDGCSSDCQSNEQCGDREPNPFLGEECDDGNHLDHDGCSSTCLKETPRWTRVDTGPPPPRRNAMIAYDSLRHRTVLFGGAGGMGNLLYNDTWEWDGTRWTRIDTISSPPPRQGGAMAFDPTRGTIVLFGGLGTSALADTWEYAGSTWRPVVVTGAPAPRYNHALAHDGTRKRLVLVGGVNVSSVFDDVYAWEGDHWEPLPSLPTVRMDHALAYDPIRGQLVLFSGRTSVTSGAIDDAWALDANGWTALPPSGAPRSSAGAAFDVANGRILVFGGTSDGTQINVQSTLSAWNGTAWSTVAIAAPPSPRSQAAVAYDIGARELVVFGGYLSSFAYDNNTFALAASWRTAPQPVQPSSTELSAAWDPERNTALVVGSAGTSDTAAQTLRWNGGFTVVASGPSKRLSPMLAHDRDEMVLAGGYVPSTTGAIDTWTWDDMWTSRATGGPLPRSSSALAGEADGLVMFGGTDGPSSLGDTWRWSNHAWSMLSPATSPIARRDHAMVFDPVRQRTVLHGGRESAATIALDDTWEWDGTTWTRMSALGSPRRMSFHRMVFDPLRQRVVAIGEENGTGTSLSEWDGVAWTAVSVAVAGPQIILGSGDAFFDPVRHGIVAIGPIASSLNDVWLFRYQSGGRDEVCGSGLDADRDGLVGCMDPDCWYICTPTCSPAMTTCDPAASRCGDGTCTGPIETCSTCSADCGACAAACGDLICSPGETCPGDC